MQQNYKIQGTDAGGVTLLDVCLKVTQYQARRVFDAFAYAMASDGSWSRLKMSLVTKRGESQVWETRFKGVKNG